MMDDRFAVLQRLQLQEEIREISDWKNDMRNKKRHLGRNKYKDIRVQALLNSALIGADSLLKWKLKLLHRYLREENEPRRKREVCNFCCKRVCSTTTSDKLSSEVKRFVKK
jgi:HEAT repeat protein